MATCVAKLRDGRVVAVQMRQQLDRNSGYEAEKCVTQSLSQEH